MSATANSSVHEVSREEDAAPAPRAISVPRQYDGAVAQFRRVTLHDFRSYSALELNLDGRPVAIAGANGAGKTNFLEALSLFGPGRGLRRAKLADLGRIHGAGGWAVSAELFDGDDARRIGVGAVASSPDRRVCRVDQKGAPGPSAFTPMLRLLWLTPAQDRLFMDGAAERRRFLDRMTMAHFPGHSQHTTNFEQALRQRQRVLEDGTGNDSWLTALENQMAEAAVAISGARCEMASLLASHSVGDDALFPAADIALEGALEAALMQDEPAAVEDWYGGELRLGRSRDREAGRALSGPHRSDLLVTHRQKQVAARLCSTGEQKALLIGLVLANARALALGAGVSGGALVLLLDEIAAHLDAHRREGLFDILHDLGIQSFMTGTDKNLFQAWGNRAQYFEAHAGALIESNL